jgi:hypothetical protein
MASILTRRGRGTAEGGGGGTLQRARLAGYGAANPLDLRERRTPSTTWWSPSPYGGGEGAQHG